jgi:hypothetical protein
MMSSAVHMARLSSLSATIEQKLIPKPLPCAKVLGNSCAVLVKVRGMLFAKPLTELITIWLDNVMDGVLLGDVTSCSLSVIVPCHVSGFHQVALQIRSKQTPAAGT